MPYFVKDPSSGVYKPFANGGTLSLVDKSTFKSGDPNNPTWEITDKWMGHPTVVTNAKNNPSSYFPDASWIKELSTKESGPYWEVEVKYGNIELLSTWTLDSNMIEPRISTHPNAILLDKARAGWTNMIEHFVDYHRNNLNDRVFNFDQVKMIEKTEYDPDADPEQTQGSMEQMDSGPNGLIRWHRPLPNGAWIYPTTGLSLFELNQLAAKYAQAFLLGQEAFQEPQWVIRNEVTVTAAFNFSLWPAMFQNVNRMVAPSQMAYEPLLYNETIPAGIVVSGVPYWHKQPIQKTQTTLNQFIINREYYGRYWFNEFTYDLATY